MFWITPFQNTCCAYNIEISECHLRGMTSNTTTMMLEMTSNTSIRSLLSGMTLNTSVLSGRSGMTSNTTTVLSEPSSFYIWTAAFIFLLVNLPLIAIFILHTWYLSAQQSVRFPNPLATGSDMHGSWRTWLPYLIIVSHASHGVSVNIFKWGEFFHIERERALV